MKSEKTTTTTAKRGQEEKIATVFLS